MRTIKKLLPSTIILLGTILAAVTSFNLYKYQTVNSLQVIGIKTTASPTSESSVETALKPVASPSPALKTTKKITQQKIQEVVASPAATSQPSPAPPSASIFIPSPALTVQKINLSISIDGGNNFSLSIEQGKTHCDVLSQALQEGKISSLNMQYNSSFNSHAVYQINGLGQDGQVWWTYSLNGKNPPLGCSHINVQNNDEVQWKYIGPR